MEPITTALGAFRFTPLLLLLNFALLIHFAFRWWLTSRRTGWSISFWDMKLLLVYFFPVLLQYPFFSAPLQSLAVGDEIYGIAEQADKAYLITVLGFLFVYVGAIMYEKRIGGTFLNLPRLMMLPFERIVSFNLRSRYTVFFLVLLALSFFPFLLTAIGSLENPFAIRDSFLANAESRPVFNAALSIFPIVPLYALLQFTDKQRSAYLIVFILSSAMLVIFGARSTLLLTFLDNVMLLVFARRSRISLIKLGMFGGLLFLAALVLGALREGSNPLYALKIVFGLFYGNNFSDLRDFSWVLSRFDDKFLFGKTELAGIMSFIPTSLSEFRQTWNGGVYTATILGFSPSDHAGVRVGLFGESYLNFGLLGVVVAGLLWGYTLKHADSSLRRAVEDGRGIRAGYVATLPFMLVSSLVWTVGFWTLYIFLLVNTSMFFLLSLLRLIRIEPSVLKPPGPA